MAKKITENVAASVVKDQELIIESETLTATSDEEQTVTSHEINSLLSTSNVLKTRH